MHVSYVFALDDDVKKHNQMQVAQGQVLVRVCALVQGSKRILL